MDDLSAKLPVFTYQTHIHLQPPQNEALEAYAELYGKVERTLFAATETGIDAMDLKPGVSASFWNHGPAVQCHTN